MNKYLLFAILILNCGCTTKNNNKNQVEDNQSENTFYTIDFPKILKSQKEIPISDIAESVEYIPLETTEESILSRVWDAKFTNDYIFIHQYGTAGSALFLTQFDRKGKFIRHIGKIGRGPGEYLLMRTFSIREENQLIYIQSNWKNELLVYTFEGEYLKTIPIEKETQFFIWSRHNLFINYNEPFYGNEKYLFTEIDSNGDIMQAVNNNFFFERKIFNVSNVYPGQKTFYRFNNSLHLKGKYNDTIYMYNSSGKIIPKFFVDLKEFKLPDELRPERGLVLPGKIPAKFYWFSVTESSQYVFFLYSAYESNEVGGPPEGGFMIYDKNTGSGNALRNQEKKLMLFNDIGNLGFTNDIDGGPELIPEYTNDSLVFHFVSSMAMKKYLGSDKFLKSAPKDPNKKEMLINNMKELKESDNDVLMVVKLK